MTFIEEKIGREAVGLGQILSGIKDVKAIQSCVETWNNAYKYGIIKYGNSRISAEAFANNALKRYLAQQMEPVYR